jgi:acyl-homoserine-lactone acylase
MLRRLALAAIVAVVALAAPATHRRVDATTAHVTLYRDTYGVPHIYGETAAAAMYAFGYAQAEDHLSQMRQNFLTAAGRRAESGLDATTAADAFMHQLKIPETGEAAFAGMNADDRILLSAFTAGINQYISDHPGQPSWMLSVEPYEVAAWVQWVSLLPEYQIAAGKMNSGPPSPPLATSPLAPQYGSNMWAVGPSHSSLGVPILQGDPHLGWTGATQWYEAHLNYPGVNVAGATFFGFPFIAMGSTDNVAWSMTDNNPNNADLYQETLNPGNPLQYLRDGVWVDMTAVTSTIKWSGHPDQQVTNYYTVHGPVISTVNDISYVAAMPSFELTGMTSVGFHLAEAPSIAAFFNPASVPTMAKWNVILADTSGHIMYVDNIRLAHKPESINWGLPVDGSLSANDWTGFLTYSELPTIVDPPHGYLQNANNSPYATAFPEALSGTFPSYLYTCCGWGERARRAAEYLDAHPTMTLDDMKAMSMDDISWSGRGLSALVGPVWTELSPTYPDPDGSIAAGVALLSTWGGTQDKGSTAVALGREWVSIFFQQSGLSFTRENIPATAGALTSTDKTNMILALTYAINVVKANLGIMNPVWGNVHVIQRAPYPAVGGGSGITPALRMAETSNYDVANKRYLANGGSSYQFVVAMTSPPQFWSIRPFGESEDPASPHYADQSALYGNNTFKQMPFTLTNVIASAESTRSFDYDAGPAVGGRAVEPMLPEGSGGRNRQWLLLLVVPALGVVLVAAGLRWRGRRRAG